MVEDVHDSIIDCEEKGLDFYLYEASWKNKRFKYFSLVISPQTTI